MMNTTRIRPRGRGGLIAFLAIIFDVVVSLMAVSAQTAPLPDAPPQAQRALPMDISGGVTFVRMSPGPDLERAALPGWHVSVSLYPLSRLGVTAEVAGARRTATLDDASNPDAPVRLRQTSFLVGPSIRTLRFGRVSARLRALLGVARLSSEFPADAASHGITGDQTPRDIGLFANETAFAAAFGSAWDIRLSRALALRLNPTLMVTRFGGDTQLTQRFSTGLVWWLRAKGSTPGS